MIINPGNTLIRWASVATLLLVVVRVQAQGKKSDKPEVSPTEQVETVQFILHPAESTFAALKYRLLPKYIERTPGNAALQYTRAALMLSDRKSYRDAIEKIDDWRDLPLDQLRNNQEAPALFDECHAELNLAHLAARRMQCDWELPVREQKWIEVLLPEVQNMRGLARLLALKARLEIAQGKIDDAVETLKTGFSLGRHVSQGPTLINGLVGVAINMLMFEQLKELIQQPDCPNLYWALTVLPNPLVDLRPAMEMEGDGVLFFIPSLREVRGAKRSEPEWNALLAKVLSEVQNMAGVVKLGDKENQPPPWFKGLQVAAALATGHEQYQAQLRAAGYTNEQIDAMCGAQLILTATVETYDRVRDDNFKWFSVPYAQAQDGMQMAIKELGPNQAAIPLVQLLLPAARAARAAVGRIDRNIAALRCVEAIRLYAATHNGQLPAQLSDIKEVPIPENPLTGEPFAYKLEDGHAVLESPPVGTTASTALRWELSIAPPKK